MTDLRTLKELREKAKNLPVSFVGTNPGHAYLFALWNHAIPLIEAAEARADALEAENKRLREVLAIVEEELKEERLANGQFGAGA